MLRRILRLRGSGKNFQFIKPQAIAAGEDELEEESPEAPDPTLDPSESPAPPVAHASPLFARRPSPVGQEGQEGQEGQAETGQQDGPGTFDLPEAPDASTETEHEEVDREAELGLEPEPMGGIGEHLVDFSKQVSRFEKAPEQQLLARAVHGLHRLEDVLGVPSSEPDGAPAGGSPEAAASSTACQDAGGQAEAAAAHTELRAELERVQSELGGARHDAEQASARARDENDALRAKLEGREADLDALQLEKAKLTAKQHRLLVKLKASAARVRSLETAATEQAGELERMSAAVASAQVQFEEAEAELGRRAEDLANRHAELARRDAELERHATERARTLEGLRGLASTVEALFPDAATSSDAELEGALARCEEVQRALLEAHAWRASEMDALAQMLDNAMWRVGKGVPRRVATWKAEQAAGRRADAS